MGRGAGNKTDECSGMKSTIALSIAVLIHDMGRAK
jgi:hypothetical protein